MAISINRMMVQGNLGKDPVVTSFTSGKTKVELSIATNSQWHNHEGQQIKQTEWHNVILWGKQAEVASKYLKKGDTVCATGPIETRRWERDGQKFEKKEIRAREFSFQTRSRAPVAGQPPIPQEEEGGGYMAEPTTVNEDLPF